MDEYFLLEVAVIGWWWCYA